MTKTYTAADFANARFAEHELGLLAIRSDPDDIEKPWVDGGGNWYSDQAMARDGWVPVPTKPTITRSELREKTRYQRIPYGKGFWDGFAHAGGELIPDPSPTDEELLAGIIRNIDDWQSITSPELLAKYLNTAGVTVNKESR